VDENYTTRETVCQSLTEKGYDVAAATSGPDAIAKIAQEKFDALILDVYLSEISGTTVMCLVKRLFPDTVIIVSSATPYNRSAFQQGAIAREFFDAGGFFAYLEKPCKTEKMVDTLERAFAEKVLSASPVKRDTSIGNLASWRRRPSRRASAVPVGDVVGHVCACGRLQGLKMYRFEARPGAEVEPDCIVVTFICNSEFNSTHLVGRAVSHMTAKGTVCDVEILYQETNGKIMSPRVMAKPKVPVFRASQQTIQQVKKRLKLSR